MTEQQTIQNWLIKRAQLTPNRVAIHFHTQTVTFLELSTKVSEVAGQLSFFGLKKGVTVAVLLKNHIDTVYIIHALQLLGCRTVLLNHRLSNTELTWQIKDSESQFVITENEWKKNIQGKNILMKSEIFNTPKITFVRNDEFFLSDVCTIMYTSGTTGYPKGVIQTYGNHWWSAIGSVLNLGLSESDAWALAVPLFHISGFSILMRSVIYGIPVILFERFDEREINLYLQQGKATIISVVSSMLLRLLDDLGDTSYHPTFRCMLLGGGPASLSLLERCKERNIPVYQTYGMTETSSQIVTLSPEDSLKKLGSAGKTLFPSNLKIVKNGKEVGPKEEGEIVVKGPNVTPGYFKREETNKKSFQDGWFYTGDIGFVDEEGYLYVLDRRSDLIISGGENIYPAEVENVLLSHPSIKEAGVVGVEDNKWGHIPCACIVLREKVEILDIQIFCEEHLAKYKVPKKWVIIDELPRNASNKLLRRELKKYFSE